VLNVAVCEANVKAVEEEVEANELRNPRYVLLSEKSELKISTENSVFGFTPVTKPVSSIPGKPVMSTSENVPANILVSVPIAFAVVAVCVVTPKSVVSPSTENSEDPKPVIST